MGENAENTQNPRKPKTMAGYLAEALDMEDRINTSIYNDYMDARNWPTKLEPNAFQNIRQYLNVLIEDTRRHRKIIAELIEKYAADKPIQ